MHIVAVSASPLKGQKKTNLPEGRLIENHGLEGDAHADGTDRQLSLLALESIESMRARGADVGPGDFAENLTTSGICLHRLPIGARLVVGEEILLELTRIGKECHSGCAIARQTGSCVMPHEGVFARILHGGIVRPGDALRCILVNTK